jgi:hypothetical protein
MESPLVPVYFTFLPSIGLVDKSIDEYLHRDEGTMSFRVQARTKARSATAATV